MASGGTSKALGPEKFRRLINIVVGSKPSKGKKIEGLTAAAAAFVVSLYLQRPTGTSEEDVLSEARRLREQKTAANVAQMVDASETVSDIATKRGVANLASGHKRGATDGASSKATKGAKDIKNDLQDTRGSSRRSKSTTGKFASRGSRSKSHSKSTKNSERRSKSSAVRSSRKRKEITPSSDIDLEQRTPLAPGNAVNALPAVDNCFFLEAGALLELGDIQKNETATCRIRGTCNLAWCFVLSRIGCALFCF